MRILLRPFSILYSVITTLRNSLFDSGILPSEVYPVPVINVGNLIAGGSGKSPHVLMLISLLKPDYKIAVLSRGYGRKTKGYRLVTRNETADTCGDEPLQYVYYHPDIKVAVCESRREGITRLLEDTYQPDIILLDDAFQHRYVKAGMNILLTEFDNPFTSDFVLPEGMLRESRSGAKRATYILVTKSPFPLPAEKANQLNKNIRRYSDAPTGYTYMRYREPESLNVNVGKTFSESNSLLIVTGIARPEAMVSYLRKTGKKVHHVRFKDHHEFSDSDFNRIRKEFEVIAHADPTAVIITTRKDAMRLASDINSPISGLPVFVMDIEAVFSLGEQEFKNALLEYVRTFE